MQTVVAPSTGLPLMTVKRIRSKNATQPTCFSQTPQVSGRRSGPADLGDQPGSLRRI